MLKMRVYRVGIFLLFMLMIAGCGEYEKILKSRDYPVKFDMAIDYYDDGEFVKAATLLDQVANIYRGTTKADTVKYYQAMSYYGQRDYLLAGHYFNELATTYGNSNYLEESEFMEAYCYYKMSPRPSLDQTSTYKAIGAFKMYMMKYPASEHIPESKEIIAELNDKIVEKSYNSAKLYYDLGYYKSAVLALRNSLSEYPETQYREELLYLILKSTYLLAENSVESKKKERLQSTTDEYLSFRSEFPESKYMKEADKIFNDTKKDLELYTTNN